MRVLGSVLGLAMTVLAGAAPAQEAGYFTVTYIEVAPSATRQAGTLLKAYRDASRKDDGNLRFDLVKGTLRPNQFAVLAAWKDQQAYETHASAAHSKTMNEKIASLLVAPNDTRQHNALSVAAPGSGSVGLCAVTHVDVIPPQKDNGMAAVKQLAEDTRKHAGNVRFDAWQQTNRPNHFTVSECWKDRKAFDAHVAAKETRDFRGKLASMTGALYDERLYKPVD